MSRSKVYGAAFLAAAAIISIGCDSSSTFLPPPPDELRGSSVDQPTANANVPIPPGLETASVGARSIELILDRRDPAQLEAYLAAARLQAGVARFKLRMTNLRQEDSPAKQVDLVREAVARDPLALILEPADPADRNLAEIVEKARQNGTPIVMLNWPLGEPSKSPETPKASGETAGKTAAAKDATAGGTSAGVKPLVLVSPPKFTESGRKLVATAIRNTKAASLDPKGGAVIMISGSGDPFQKERIAAVRSALKQSGITTVEEISFSGPVDAGAKLLTAKLKANPKMAMVFSVDSQSTSASRQVMTELIPDRMFVQAAYAAEGNYGDMTRVGDFAAVAGFIPTALVRKAILTAVKLSQGMDMPSHVEVPVEVIESPEGSTTPQSPAFYKSRDAAKKNQ